MSLMDLEYGIDEPGPRQASGIVGIEYPHHMGTPLSPSLFAEWLYASIPMSDRAQGLRVFDLRSRKNPGGFGLASSQCSSWYCFG